MKRISSGCLFVFPEKTLPLHFHHTENSFLENSLAHLARSLCPVSKYYRHLYDLKPVFPGGKFHFNLECIADKTDLVEINRLQHLPFVTFEASSCVFYFDPGHQTNIH